MQSKLLARPVEIAQVAGRLLRNYYGDVRLQGLASASVFFYAEISSRRLLRFLGPRRDKALLRLPLRDYPHPFYFRHGTSDVSVIRQVLYERQYAGLGALDSPRLILDCGANIGASAAYLLHRHPTATLIAVEPDPGNYEVCRLNLAPFGARARVVQAAVWPYAAGLRLQEALTHNGVEWAYQVRPCGAGEEPDVHAATIGNLLRESGHDQIDLLKIDIEGAERQLFGENCQDWLPHTRNIAIELHGEEDEAAFFRALHGYQFDLERAGELTICRGIRAGGAVDGIAPARAGVSEGTACS